MRSFIMLLILTALLVTTVGCGSEEAAFSVSQGDGMVEDRHTRRRRYAGCYDVMARQIQDDWDEIVLMDNNCKLSMWNVYFGN